MSLTLWRSVVMLKTDPSLTLTMLTINTLQAIIVSSIFYNLSETTAAFQNRAVLLFFVILMNAFSSILEIISLYAKRKIVEKHARYVQHGSMLHSTRQTLTRLGMHCTIQALKHSLQSSSTYRTRLSTFLSRISRYTLWAISGGKQVHSSSFFWSSSPLS